MIAKSLRKRSEKFVKWLEKKKIEVENLDQHKETFLVLDYIEELMDSIFVIRPEWRNKNKTSVISHLDLGQLVPQGF